MNEPSTADRPTASTGTEPATGRIVVGLDGSPSSGEALTWALRQAALTGARVQAVACWEWPVSAAGVIPMDDLSDSTSQAARDVIAEVSSRLPEDQRPARDAVETLVVQGYPSQVLVEAAEGATLLVVGSHGRGGFGRMLLGSVGLHCASHAPCPVVIVRHAKDGADKG